MNQDQEYAARKARDNLILDVMEAAAHPDHTLRYWFGGKYGRWVVDGNFNLIVGFELPLPRPE